MVTKFKEEAVISKLYPAYGNRNFKLYIWGQLISSGGNWLQIALEGWIIYLLTSSSWQVGVNGFWAALPVMLFAPVGGLIITRFDLRKTLMFTTVCALSQAVVLGYLSHANLLTVFWLNFFATCLGVINIFEAPARQVFFMDLVGTEHKESASAMNSAIVNVSQFAGPAILGICIKYAGFAGTFWLNAGSFFAVLVTLIAIKAERRPPRMEHPFLLAKEGFSHLWHNRATLMLVILAGITVMFGFSIQRLLPAITKQMFAGDATLFGKFVAAIAFGAVCGSAIYSRCSVKQTAKDFICQGCFLMGFMLLCFGILLLLHMRSLYLVLPVLFFHGIGFAFTWPPNRAQLQRVCPRQKLPLVMGWAISSFFGGITLGNFLAGWFAKLFGEITTIIIFGEVLLVVGIVFWLHPETLEPHVED